MNYVRPSHPIHSNISEAKREEDKNKDAQTWYVHLSFALSQHDKSIEYTFSLCLVSFLQRAFATGFDCGNLVIFMAENGILITQQG